MSTPTFTTTVFAILPFTEMFTTAVFNNRYWEFKIHDSLAAYQLYLKKPKIVWEYVSIPARAAGDEDTPNPE